MKRCLTLLEIREFKKPEKDNISHSLDCQNLKCPRKPRIRKNMGPVEQTHAVGGWKITGRYLGY